jgi:parvulin-like peptidyl-prolyl isomerase
MLRLRLCLFGLITTIFLLLTIAGCKKSDISREDIEKADWTIAAIESSINVKASELYDRLKKSDLLKDGGFLDSSTYFDTLEAIVQDTLISLEAKKVNLQDHFNSYWTYKDRFRGFFTGHLFRNQIVANVQIDSAMVDNFYQSNQEKFIVKEQVHARHLFVSPQSFIDGPDANLYKEYSKMQLDSLAEKLIREYHSMVDSNMTFGDIAYLYSMHTESARNYGDMGYFTRGSFAREFDDIVFALDSGVIHGPFQTSEGWHVVEILDHIDSGLVELEGQYYDFAYNQLLSELSRKEAILFVDSLLKAAEYEFNDSSLIRPPHLVPAEEWSVIINRRDTLPSRGLYEILSDFARVYKIDSLTLEDKHNALKEVTRQTLILQAGIDLGYGNDSTVVKERNKLYHKYCRSVILRQGEDPSYRPPDSLIQDYYDKHIDDYVIKKPINVQHIIVQDSVFGEFLRDQALSGVDFIELAEMHYPGAEEIRRTAADLGFIGPKEMPDEFYDMAMRTPVGDVSHPVKTEFGYHIIKVIDKQLTKSIEQVKGYISSTLSGEYRKEFRENWRRNLFSSYDIQYNLEPIKLIELPPKEMRK